MSTRELLALRTLRNNHDYVIKRADKGGATVVWRRDLYISEGERQLSNQATYQPLPDDPTSSDIATVKQTIKSLIRNNQLPATANSLINTDATCPNWYMLLKIHKPDNPGRPIVSACNSPTVVISEFVDSVLQPIVQKLPTYIKDTNEAVKMFENFEFKHAGGYIFTMYVKSLYTSIPINDGLVALRYFLEKDGNKPRICSVDTIIRLSELVLCTTAFAFNHKYYRQMSGVSMGSKMAPSFACLFMGHLEHQILAQFKGPKPELFKRYIDDCIGATSGSIEELHGFINFANNFHPAIAFTYEISSNSMAFLDIKLSIEELRLTTSVHYKSTDAHTYLNYASSHPPSCKQAIPYSQFLRLRRICSNDEDFKSKTQEKTFKGYVNNLFLKFSSVWFTVLPVSYTHLDV
ncbi:uncharacterized protein LOC117103523 [Anneissia japonica]|uniref:uncharacterized protein LOC117103523 n=1 Tax=Anneissia japonica TaxID=1529436 RepID=UPI0014256594|nr:uncharacterized protein LOC117103523 [Anneissia japonica]